MTKLKWNLVVIVGIPCRTGTSSFRFRCISVIQAIFGNRAKFATADAFKGVAGNQPYRDLFGFGQRTVLRQPYSLFGAGRNRQSRGGAFPPPLHEFIAGISRMFRTDPFRFIFAEANAVIDAHRLRVVRRSIALGMGSV